MHREYKEIRLKVPWGHVLGRWYGNQKVRPILAIHGWLDNLGTWDTVIPLLPDHVGILCIDLPGHGRSSKLPLGIHYHLIDYVQMIVRFMQEYSWPKVSLMGHSMGSIICFMYTALFPHMVDMLISIDVIFPVTRSPSHIVKQWPIAIEKALIENERQRTSHLREPPSYSYEALKQILYEGSWQSVELKNAKYILDRSIMKSTKYPDKYYFSRDGRVKFYKELDMTFEQCIEMTSRVHNIPYIVVKGSESQYLNTDVYGPIIDILASNNPHFEYHVVFGTHHVHLNNPEGVAAVLSPFIRRHRPATLDGWTVSEEKTENAVKRPHGSKKHSKWPLTKYLRSKL